MKSENLFVKCWIRGLNLFPTKYLGFFFFPRLKSFSLARQNTECERETVTFNSSFFEFMVAFLGVDLSDCPCEETCPSVTKYVKLYLYRTYVRCQRDPLSFRVICVNFIVPFYLSIFTETPTPSIDSTQMVRMHI